MRAGSGVFEHQHSYFRLSIPNEPSRVLSSPTSRFIQHRYREIEVVRVQLLHYTVRVPLGSTLYV